MKIINNFNKNIFRAYDIRGVYGVDLNKDFAYTLGKSFASYILNLGKSKCVVGRDNRLSSPELAAALIQGIIESGVDVIDLGLCTTPMFYYAQIFLGIPSGVMVTASHNPKDDNGFKFSFDERGNARGEMIEEFLAFTLKGDFKTGIGLKETYDILPEYIKLFKNNIYLGNRKIKVILDPGNGTTADFIYKIFSEFDIDFKVINGVSDGTFPNHHPDPVVEDNLLMLKQAVIDYGADIGIGFDGDGDRLGIISENAKFIPTDIFMSVVIRDLIDKVKNKSFLCDIKCSKTLFDEIERLGANIVLSRTGNSYTKAMVLDNNLPFGGEYSGHIYFNDRFKGFDSGIYGALRIIEILSNTRESFSYLTRGLNKYYSTPEIKIKSNDEMKKKVVDLVIDYARSKNYELVTIDGARVNFIDGWALIRYSNTGPDITVRFEAQDEIRLEEIKNEFMEIILKENKI